MLIKESLLFVFILVLGYYMNNECHATRCYSCSDCNNATKLTTWTPIQTLSPTDQCMRAIILTEGTRNGRKLVSRGASLNCKPFSGTYSSIFCCNTDLCND